MVTRSVRGRRALNAEEVSEARLTGSRVGSLIMYLELRLSAICFSAWVTGARNT